MLYKTLRQICVESEEDGEDNTIIAALKGSVFYSIMLFPM